MGGERSLGWRRMQLTWGIAEPRRELHACGSGSLQEEWDANEGFIEEERGA